MRLKTIVDEDFTNYKQPVMFIGTISCAGKCCIEAGIPLSVCQNDGWRSSPVIDMPDENICKRYLSNPITKAIVLGGLEPFEQFEEVLNLLETLRNEFSCSDEVILYTGYRSDEISKQIQELKKYSNVIVKFGRYVPNKNSRYDSVLGVKLASENQYAERIS